MPIKIRGNESSDQFLILLPGGPSGDGLAYSTLFPAFTRLLEARCRMVYYDQRGAGNCQGRYDTATLDLPQLSEDLRRIVWSLKSRYRTAKVYLLGYSYGGALGLHYLLDPERRSEISGFVSIAGAFDRAHQREQQERLVNYCLDRWVEDGYLDSHASLSSNYRCETAPDIAACREDSAMTARKVLARFEQVERYNQFKLDPAGLGRLLQFVFFSQSNPIQSGITEGQNGRYFQDEFDRLVLSRQLGDLDLPALFINGRYDTNVPFFAAQDGFDRIATAPDRKSLVILESSGHLPMQTEPQKLAEPILDFLVRY